MTDLQRDQSGPRRLLVVSAYFAALQDMALSGRFSVVLTCLAEIDIFTTRKRRLYGAIRRIEPGRYGENFLGWTMG